jgi:hypothetical protein
MKLRKWQRETLIALAISAPVLLALNALWFLPFYRKVMFEPKPHDVAHVQNLLAREFGVSARDAQVPRVNRDVNAVYFTLPISQELNARVLSRGQRRTDLPSDTWQLLISTEEASYRVLVQLPPNRTLAFGSIVPAGDPHHIEFVEERFQEMSETILGAGR